MSWDELVCSSAAASGELEASVLQGASVVRSQGLRSVSYRVTGSKAEKVERVGHIRKQKTNQKIDILTFLHEAH